jgi:asparagine synthase (glutamine-hydrolysing)
MCGIVGLWNIANELPRATVATMLEAMKHRGPDGSGILEFAGGAAGMVRLALVDLSERGQQPLWSADGRVAILFNGEIYNFRTERERLEKLGHRFRTTTDTEVILHLYLEHSLDFHSYLRGMYALALFDWRQTAPGGLPKLILARGPLGIKPLYIAHPDSDPEQVVFSSEVRALLAGGLVPAEVDRESLAAYLTHGFVLQPGTLIKGVRMLEPGTIEIYTPGERPHSKRFWQFPPYAPRTETLDEAAERLRGVLEESVKLHAMADAPIGAFLSGGIDSTGIVGLMRKHIADLHTYTVKFPGLDDQDEVNEAVSAAQAYGCRHTVVEVTGGEVAELMPRFAGEMDQPSADGLNTWLISRAAARDVKGVLSGVGGDEWFAGYPVTRRMARYATTVGGRAQVVAGKMANVLAGLLPRGHLRSRAENLATRRSALATWLQGHTVFNFRLSRHMAGLGARRGLQDEQFDMLLQRELPNWKSENAVGLSCLLDTRIYMTDQLLRDCDATSMAHSLELRVPLVDVELAQFSRTCADDYKLRPDGGNAAHYRGSGAKRVLIHALRDVLPASIAERRKRGFSLPYAHWMRNELHELIDDTCSQRSLSQRGLINPDLVARIRSPGSAHLPGLQYPKLWTLMVFELWCRAVLDGARPRAAAPQAVSV